MTMRWSGTRPGNPPFGRELFRMLFSWTITLACLLPASGNAQSIRLDVSDGWTLSHPGDDTVIPAGIPGAIHHDLLQAGLIPDPYLEDHALHLGWVDSTVWVYRRRIPFPRELAALSHVDLVFEGLDTRADVYIGEQLVLSADNMFRSWRIPLAAFRHMDSLEVAVHIHPAILHGAERVREVPWTYPADSDPYAGKPSVFLRKAPYQFGWDFAPSMPGGGIWRPVRLEAWAGIHIHDLWVETLEVNESGAVVNIHLGWHAEREDSLSLIWQLGHWGGIIPIRSRAGENQVTIPARLEGARSWWPRGEGEQILYPLEAILQKGQAMDWRRTRVGLRTVHLDRSADDWGTAFQFRVNGKPVFCQGANWVPADMFPGRVGTQTYEHLLGLAAEAGMNMLRVWGGGIYEHPRFYELADSLGIMIWQDFMFAGTMYPGDSAFMENVRAEATEQIRRLRVHPSVSLWCGNNEVEVAWANWDWPKTYAYLPEQQARMEADYHRLFRELLPSLVSQGHPGVDYLSSSPVSNWGERADLDHGNNHFWGVWHGEMPLDSLNTWVPRFMTEYGMPSYPHWQSLIRVNDGKNAHRDSHAMAHRMRSYKGNRLLDRYILAEMGEIPTEFQDWVAAGHRVQARALEIAIRAHLADRPRCAGTLMWQFNEPWPGVSWSIVDHYGRVKPAYAVVQRLYDRP